jgi:subtilisin family serine protease
MSIVLSLLLTLSLIPGQQPAGPDANTIRVLVRDPTGLAQAAVAGQAVTVGSDRQAGWVAMEVVLTGSVEQTVEDLSRKTKSTVILEPRYDLFGPADEPSFSQQWYLENTGQTGGLADADIDSAQAWIESTGSGVVVAVIDSGVDATHPDLAGRIAGTGWDFVDDDPDPSPVGTSFDEAHGTAVAGLIAATVNGSGITGVSPEAKIMVVRACSGGGCWSDDVSDAIHFAVDHGADIINLSLGSITNAGDPLMESAIDYAQTRDVAVVAAAGNQGKDLDHLAGGQMLVPGGLPYSNIITVASTDDRDRRASFSNYGANTVDIAAPGSEILTLGIGGGYVLVDGTSFSAPVVSGVAALLLAKDPGITYLELIARIKDFTDEPASIAGLFQTGRVNAGRSLTQRFVDTSSSVFRSAVDWLAAMHITKGCNPPYNDRFCPSGVVSRGEMAVFLARAFGLSETSNDYFDDDTGRFYEGAANRMAAAGLTVGCGGRNYCGSADIHRDEMAAMLARALSLPITQVDRFIDDDGSIFENAINKIAQAGITEGCNPPGNDRYCPTDRVTRGQMAALVKRSIELAG